MSSLRKYLTLALGFIAALAILGCQGHLGSQSNALSVSAPLVELPKGYLKWLHQHPELMSNPDGSHPQINGKGGTYNIAWPHLDIYKPDGTLLFYGENSKENVDVLNGLPQHLPQQTSSGTPLAIRPTLLEATAMFPEITRTGKFIASKGMYTVFAVVHPKRPECTAQDQAVQDLVRRVKGTNVRIVEVRLSSGE